jgi:hypothetical protein
MAAMAGIRRGLSGAVVALALGGLGGAALAGCGGSETKTETVSGGPTANTTATTPPTSTTSTSTARTTTTSTSTGAETAPTSTAGGTSAEGTHSAPEPAFTEQEAHTEGLKEAVSVLTAHGYSPNDTSQYNPKQTLRVLIGTKSASSEGYDQQAFFFIDGRYIGTDTKLPSASIKVVSQSDTEVTLAYALYNKGAPLSAPSGTADVTFQLNDGKLGAAGTIPPTESATGAGRL